MVTVRIPVSPGWKTSGIRVYSEMYRLGFACVVGEKKKRVQRRKSMLPIFFVIGFIFFLTSVKDFFTYDK